ncbi:MAG: cyclodeaminase/cyclohydrolase family protein [Elusimicrobiota bacterium]|nr:cyclodeaminase/cyclohydrolase family protein [Elusimicrobiota bacterium]
MTFLNGSIKNYLEKLAGRIPAPGGGSAAALAAALGASLIEMSAAYSLKSSGKEMKKALSDIKKIRKKLEKQIDADGIAYENYRKKRTDSALKKAAGEPIRVCELSSEAIAIGVFVAKKGNANLRSDTVAGLCYLFAALTGAALPAMENLKRVKDRSCASKAEKQLASLRKKSAKLFDSVKLK